MKYQRDTFKNGFTLLEVIAVLIVLGILIAVAVPRFFSVPDDAAEAALKLAVVELNARENLAWGRWKSDSVSYTVADIKNGLKGFTVSDDSTMISSDVYNMKAVVSRAAPTDGAPGKWTVVSYIQ